MPLRGLVPGEASGSWRGGFLAPGFEGGASTPEPEETEGQDLMSESTDPASETQVKTPRTYADRWKYPELLQSGYLVVPSDFMRHYSRLEPHGLSHGEALFVLHLMEFKWGQAPPFPSYTTLASRMGVTPKMARRYAQSLERKGCLRRMRRTGNTNFFDLTPLFNKLLVQANVPGGVISRLAVDAAVMTKKQISDAEIPF